MCVCVLALHLCVCVTWRIIMCLFSVVLNIFTINAALHGFFIVEYFPDFLSVSQFACVGGWVQFSLSCCLPLYQVSVSHSVCASLCHSLSLSLSVCLSV